MNPLQLHMNTQKQKPANELFPILLMGCFFLIIHGLAIVVAGPFEDAGVEAFENPDDPMNLVIFFGILLVMTLLILVIAKYWKKQLIQFLILGAIGYTSFYVFLPLLALLLPDLLALFLAIVFAVVILIALYKYPEWYIIDFSGVIIGAGAIAIFGISLGILLILILKKLLFALENRIMVIQLQVHILISCNQ